MVGFGTSFCLSACLAWKAVLASIRNGIIAKLLANPPCICPGLNLVSKLRDFW